MRVAVAVAAAAMIAGFTPAEAEKALDGEWAGTSSAVGIEINAQAKTAKIIRAGKTVSGPFTVENVSAGAATVSVGSEKLVLHVRNDGKTLIMSPVGSTNATYLNRVR